MRALKLGPVALFVAVLACGPPPGELDLHGLVPDAASARGGEVSRLTGSGFLDGATVTVGGQPAQVIERLGPDGLRVTLPPTIAGSHDVVVRNPDGAEATLAGGFQSWPLYLWFEEAAAHHLPTLDGLEVADAAVADIDGDGDIDVVLGAAGGWSRVLLNSGLGGFTDGDLAESEGSELPRWRGATKRVLPHDFDQDGDVDLLVCNASGASSRLFVNQGGGGFVDETGGGLPLETDECLAAAVADLDGDGWPDVAWAGRSRGGGPVHLRAWLNEGVRGAASFDLVGGWSLPVGTDGQTVGDVWTSDPALTGSCSVADLQAARGAASGRLSYDFAGLLGQIGFRLPGPAIDEVPTGVQLELYGDGSGHSALVRVRDAADERFEAEIGPIDWVGWRTISLDAPATWPSWGGDADGVFEAPVNRLILLLEAAEQAPSAGELFVDDVLLVYPGLGPTLVDDFERLGYDLEWHETPLSMSAADVQGDGTQDLIVAGTSSDPDARLRLFVQGAGADPDLPFVQAAAGALPATPDPSSAAVPLDSDRDGDADLVIISTGQDRLLENDGSGHFFDDTFASMPVDWVDGRSAQASDLNRDGWLDLLVANDGAVDRLYLGRANGGFVDETPLLPLLDSPTLRLLPADVDGDGDSDLLVVRAGGGDVGLYICTAGSETP